MSAPEPIRAMVSHAAPLPCLAGRDRRLVILAGEASSPVTIPGVDPRDVATRVVTIGDAGAGGSNAVLSEWGGRLWRPLVPDGPPTHDPLPLAAALYALARPGKHSGVGLAFRPFVVETAAGIVGRRSEALPEDPPPTRRTVLEDLGAAVRSHVAMRLGRDLFHDGQALHVAVPFPVARIRPRAGTYFDPFGAGDAFPGTRPDRLDEYRALLDAADPSPFCGEAQDRVGLAMACERLRGDLAGLEPDDGEVFDFANGWPLALLPVIERLVAAARRPREVARAGDLCPEELGALRDGLQRYAARGSVGMLEGAEAAEALRACVGVARALHRHGDIPRIARDRTEMARMYAVRIAMPRLEERLAPPDEDEAGLSALAPVR